LPTTVPTLSNVGRISGLREKVFETRQHSPLCFGECDRVFESRHASGYSRNSHDAARKSRSCCSSATLSKEIRPVCRKFCQDPMRFTSTTNQAHLARIAIVLLQSRRSRKEPQTQRSARFA
jgi:superfamily II DNA/RNA helicase